MYAMPCDHPVPQAPAARPQDALESFFVDAGIEDLHEQVRSRLDEQGYSLESLKSASMHQRLISELEIYLQLRKGEWARLYAAIKALAVQHPSVNIADKPPVRASPARGLSVTRQCARTPPHARSPRRWPAEYAHLFVCITRCASPA